MLTVDGRGLPNMEFLYISSLNITHPWTKQCLVIIHTFSLSFLAPTLQPGRLHIFTS